MPPIVHDVLRSPGQALDAATRGFMEPRFGHDFGSVRVHTGARAAESARAVDAVAYTVGRDVVFDAGRYAPGTPGGQHLLAHELAHVVQQDGTRAGSSGAATELSLAGGRSDPAEQEAAQAAAQIATGQPLSRTAGRQGLSVQRQEGGEEEERPRLPGAAAEPRYQLRLDPEIEAQMLAARQAQLLLSPETIRLSLTQADLGAILGTPPPPWVTAPPAPQPGPLVPRGAGPAEPRPATAGDLLGAVMRIPSVEAAVNTLKTNATDQLSHGWRSLSTGERVAVISQTAIIGGGTLAGVLSNPEARTFVLGQLQNRTLPVPGVPGLTFQFNATGPNQVLKFDLNVGRLLPASWGFR